MFPGAGERPTPAWVGGVAVAALGLALCVGYAEFFLSTPGDLATALYGALAPAAVSLAVGVSGGWLAAHGEGGRTAAWCYLCAATFGAFALLVVNYQWLAGGSFTDAGLVLLNAVTGGAGVGVLVGRYDERVRRTQRDVARREAELERERDRFRALFENLPNPAMRFRVPDGEPVIEEVNGAFVETFGYTGGEAIGQRVRDLLVPAGRKDEASAIASRLETGDTVSEQVRRVTDDGVRDFLLFAIPIRVEPTTGHAVLVDVTDRERHVQRLEVLNRVLRHDLRNDANVILGYAEALAEEEAGRRNEGETEHAAVIQERARRMVERGDRAREVGSMLADADEEGRVNLATVLRERAAELRESHPEADVSVRTEDDLPVYGGPLLAEAFTQLFTNAVEHNDATEPRVRVEARGPEDGFATVAVRDDGPGVPEREREVLERGRETALEHSLGMGLWLARWAVEEVGGNIEIHDLANGTEILVRVPVAE
jgi:PAS domain S-box-containing protein